jgi:hypothetical protein
MSKPVLTCRTTTIESFREWINSGDDDDKPWVTEDGVISNIKGIETQNIKASFGSCGHCMIENPDKYRVDIDPQPFTTIASAKDLMPYDGPEYYYQVKDFSFSIDQAKPMIKFRQEHPLMIREVALSKLYSTPSFDLIVTGTCDHLEGNIMRDTKFKFSSFDVQDFVDSFQWRNYLNSAEMDIFWYDFFRVKNFSVMSDMAKARISECESMMVKRYSGMEADINAIIVEFMEFVIFKGLTEHLVITDAKRKRIAAGDSKLLKLI